MPPKAKTEAICGGLTKSGQPCKLTVKGDTGFCWRHAKEGEAGAEEDVTLHTTRDDEEPEEAPLKGGTVGEADPPSFSFATDKPAVEGGTFSFGSTPPVTSAEETKYPAFSFGSNEELTTTTSTTATSTAATTTSNPFQFDFSKSTAFSFDAPPPQPIPVTLSSGSLPTFKVVIAGDGGVGKTSFVEKWVKGDFPANYEPTLGALRNDLTLHTNLGDLKLDLWDLAGQEKYGGLRDGYYIGAQAAILCFDVTSKSSYKSIPTWYRDIVRVCEHIPIVLVGLKADVGTQRQAQHEQGDFKGGQGPLDAAAYRTVLHNQIVFHRKKNLQYYDVSTKTLLNIGKPFTHILQKLTASLLTIEHSLLTAATDAEETGEEEKKEATPSTFSFTGAVPFGVEGGESSDNAHPFGHCETAAPAASTPSFHLSGSFKDTQPSPFEARFGSNPVALSFQPDTTIVPPGEGFPSPEPKLSFSFGEQKPFEFNSPFSQSSFAQSPSTFTFGTTLLPSSSSSSSSFSAFSPFAGPVATADSKDAVADLANQLEAGVSLGRPRPRPAKSAAEAKIAPKGVTTAALLDLDLEDEDEEGDPDYDPDLDEGDEGEEGDEGDFDFGEGDEGEEEEEVKPQPKAPKQRGNKQL